MLRQPNPLLMATAVSTLFHAALLAAPFGSAAARASAPLKADFVFVQVRLPERPAGGLAAVPSKAPAPGAGTAVRSKPSARPASEPVPYEELLSDPVKEKLFLPYFQSVKDRIRASAERHEKFVLKERGKVEVDFVLNRRGLITGMDARPDNEAAGNPMLVARALTILRESEPFDRFPSEIKAESIAFNITLVFDG